MQTHHMSITLNTNFALTSAIVFAIICAYWFSNTAPSFPPSLAPPLLQTFVLLLPPPLSPPFSSFPHTWHHKFHHHCYHLFVFNVASGVAICYHRFRQHCYRCVCHYFCHRRCTHCPSAAHHHHNFFSPHSYHHCHFLLPPLLLRIFPILLHNFQDQFDNQFCHPSPHHSCRHFRLSRTHAAIICTITVTITFVMQSTIVLSSLFRHLCITFTIICSVLLPAFPPSLFTVAVAFIYHDLSITSTVPSVRTFTSIMNLTCTLTFTMSFATTVP